MPAGGIAPTVPEQYGSKIAKLVGRLARAYEAELDSEIEGLGK